MRPAALTNMPLVDEKLGNIAVNFWDLTWNKPLKYPLIFQVCDALIINKIDVLPYFDFDMDKVKEYAHRRNPNLKLFPISAKTGEGIDALCDWLREQAAEWNN